MSIAGADALLSELRDRGVELRVDGEHLCFRPQSAMTPELIERVRAAKPELIARHTSPPAPKADAKFRIERGPMSFGDVCWGWTPKSWAVELRRKAERCQELKPDLAKHYRTWAADIESRLGGRKE